MVNLAILPRLVYLAVFESNKEIKVIARGSTFRGIESENALLYNDV
jgi:hypothetical protein